MKHLSLASRYRPQTFAQVAGQDMVKAVLSRAAAENRPAAAYLLSGTRGVGKTTIARIFAKALNCEEGPTKEPCNRCGQCRKITTGNHVDVAEIDGASNNSVEDARALRETIGYAPMEGRYKVFIIDEAHMLTRNAFNALLKTLEEPPERVVFIFATTEVHKFPITIVSRCQHFVFRHLSEEALIAHLSHVLQQEGLPFEESAIRLLARRAAGSVRDSMSLLDQVIALGDDKLSTESTRRVLGLAGQEAFAHLFDALQKRDCAGIAMLATQILSQGVDIGFFVRELAVYWRNLFLLRHGGTAILPSLHLPDDEAIFLQNIAAHFGAAHSHAAWQMTLDAQRGIVQNPEPAAALELLLLNLALLPQLLPMERSPSDMVKIAPPSEKHGGSGVSPRTIQAAPKSAVPAPGGTAPLPLARSGSGLDTGRNDTSDIPAQDDPPQPVSSKPKEEIKSEPSPQRTVTAFTADWQTFCKFCADEDKEGRLAPQQHILHGLDVEWQKDCLRLTPKAESLLPLLEKQLPALKSMLSAFGAGHLQVEIVQPTPQRSKNQLLDDLKQDPRLQGCIDILGAVVTDCGNLPTSRHKE